MKAMMRPPLAMLLVCLCGAGCADTNREGTPAFALVDSGGVPIASNSADAIRDAPRRVLREDVRIGTVDGPLEEAFVGMLDVGVDGEGTVFVADLAARTVHVFDAGGVWLGRFGRPGDGPGEFPNEILRMATGRDTILLLDRFRLHLFTTDRRHLHTTEQKAAGNEIVPTLGPGADGWVVGRSESTRPSGETDRIRQDTFRVRPVNVETGAPGAPLIEIPAGRRWYFDDLFRSWPQYLAPEPRAAVRENGEIFVTDGLTYDVAIHSPDGTLARRVRGGVTPPPLGPEATDEAVDRMTAYYDSAGAQFRPLRDGVIQSAGALGPAPARPIPGRLLVAANGSILLERRDLDPDPFMRARADSTTWDVLDAEGRIEGRIVLGPRVDPEQFTGDALYTVERDDLDVRYVVKYGLVPPEGAARPRTAR